MNGELLIEAVRAKGSDARDLRDAAHEACHALMWKAKKWDRDSIHKKKPRGLSYAVADEITARAVEQLVCAEFGVDCGTVEHWAGVCFMEMIKNERVSLPSYEWVVDAVKKSMKTDKAREMSKRVIALGGA